MPRCLDLNEDEEYISLEPRPAGTARFGFQEIKEPPAPPPPPDLNRIEVGDKVVCIRATDGADRGDQRLVVEVHVMWNSFRVSGSKSWFHNNGRGYDGEPINNEFWALIEKARR